MYSYRTGSTSTGTIVSCVRVGVRKWSATEKPVEDRCHDGGLLSSRSYNSNLNKSSRPPHQEAEAKNSKKIIWYSEQQNWTTDTTIRLSFGRGKQHHSIRIWRLLCTRKRRKQWFVGLPSFHSVIFRWKQNYDHKRPQRRHRRRRRNENYRKNHERQRWPNESSRVGFVAFSSAKKSSRSYKNNHYATRRRSVSCQRRRAICCT